MVKRKESYSVVKIDNSLLKEIEEFINQGENKFTFVNKKQFVDLAVYNFLKKMKEKKK
jgi:hypothetical protein